MSEQIVHIDIPERLEIQANADPSLLHVMTDPRPEFEVISDSITLRVLLGRPKGFGHG
jgi:hypothetical protein